MANSLIGLNSPSGCNEVGDTLTLAILLREPKSFTLMSEMVVFFPFLNLIACLWAPCAPTADSTIPPTILWLWHVPPGEHASMVFPFPSSLTTY